MEKSFKEGEKVFHKSSGAPMVVVEAGPVISTRWLDVNLHPQIGRFKASELIKLEDHPVAKIFEESQKVKTEIELIQAKEMLRQLKTQKLGIQPLQRQMPRA